MLDLLDKATRSLQSSLTAPHLNETEIQGLFSDCGEKAIRVGKKMEVIYGGGIPSVQKLEDYCGNYAASVLPGFYVRELKNHADKVIVQSENMRQIYVNVLSEQYGEETRKEWENKILGLGSPKYDNTRNIITNTPILPEAWLTRIRKPDGSRKKVILYYTSISMLLRCEDQMLKKMKHVFRVFLERKDDITLLWHSHPLTEAAISAMCPRMLEEYRKMVEEYKAEGWGIYDDSPELDRVGALCDAYYGDYSRLAQMCREAGKPIMIQCVDIM